MCTIASIIFLAGIALKIAYTLDMGERTCRDADQIDPTVDG